MLAVAFVLAGCSGGAAHHGAAPTTGRSSSSSLPTASLTAGVRHASLAGITFDYPSHLHVDPIPVDEHYVQIIGYVSNERLHPPCTTTHIAGETTTRCGMPVKHLSPGGVLVAWSFNVAPGGGRDLMSSMPGVATVVAGRPAKLYIASNPTTVNNDCYGLGAARFVKASVRPPGANNATLFMLACLDRRALSQQPAIVAMLNSVRFTT
jgi:hypothetical protein